MADVTITPRAREAQWLLHCAPGDAAAVSSGLAIALGSVMLRAAATDGWHALHLAPDEWLLIGLPGAVPGAVAEAHSLIDISDRSLGFDLAGADVADALNAACPLDLGDAAFPVGACTRTLFGKVMVMLWRTGAASWRIDCGRSFEPYVGGLLALAIEDADD